MRAMQARLGSMRAWGAVIVWATVVWRLGGDGFSAAHTSRFLGPLVAFLFPHLSEEERAPIVFFLRKAAHVAEYALLALLTSHAAARSGLTDTARNLGASLGVAFLLASADELRQSASPARTGSPERYWKARSSGRCR